MIKKVIIIDDSLISLNILKTAFAKNMWDVYSATSASEALDIIFNVAPDLIITDAVMPKIGGFQFVKITRENSLISKIPIIIYSVLPEANAKFYIKEDNGEYFLSKKNDCEKLLQLAETVVSKHPISEKYKANIVFSKLKNETMPRQVNKQEDFEKETKIEENELMLQFKEKYDFSLSDEKIFTEIYPLLYKILNYNLCVISVDYFEKKKKTVFCDIKDVILSPIFQNSLLDKYSASDIVLYKKYAPNLKMIVNEDEFFSKIEFNFNYKGENIANIAFYSTKENKWTNEKNKEILENILFNFFRARYVNKKVAINKNDNYKKSYFQNKFDFSIFNKVENPTKENMYICIIDITNYEELSEKLSMEEIDILNSKISEKIINFLNKDEQIYKNDDEEYVAVIYAKDSGQAVYKFNTIANIISKVSEDYKVEVSIGASNCTIEGNYNIYEAQKNARNALEKTSKTENVVLE